MAAMLPATVQNALRHGLRNVRGLAWGSLNLECVLRSGLKVIVKNPADWVIYNEILVNGEYDYAINHVLDRSGSEVRVLDLGANVGYFILRFADMFLQRCGGKSLSIVAVEGSPGVTADLRNRINAQALLFERVRVIHGLVGERSGVAYISDNPSHYGNSIVDHEHYRRSSVAYIDLVSIVDHGDIDLLKCDIEGSEFTFLKNYPDLLSRVKNAVFEFHKYGEDLDHYRGLLARCGLERLAILRDTSTFRVEMYGRHER